MSSSRRGEDDNVAKVFKILQELGADDDASDFEYSSHTIIQQDLTRMQLRYHGNSEFIVVGQIEIKSFIVDHGIDRSDQ